MLLQISQVINVYFANFMELLRNIDDVRDESADYKIEELVFACIAMFIFKQGSRHHFNQLIKKKKFKRNFKQIFKLRLPHMDTVDVVLRQLDSRILEEIKVSLLKKMIKKKTLAKYRLFDTYHLIAVDATGVHHFKEQHCQMCSHKTQSKGKFKVNSEALEKLKNEGVPENIVTSLKKLEGMEVRSKAEFAQQMMKVLGEDDYEKYQPYLIKHCGSTSWFHNVLEARLVSSNGFSLSVATEWIENSESGYEKQDCELKAFHRLSKKIKTMFPQLSICIVVDGLYANKALFNRCSQLNWPYIVAFKKGNLKSVWTKINSLIPITKDNTEHKSTKNKETYEDYTWINNIAYEDHTLNWVKCKENRPPNPKNKTGITHFVYLSSFEITKKNFLEIVEAGRLRQKIENEGFNTQKNLGYKMTHKYSRVSPLASKNYFQSLQIAHMIVSIVELCKTIKEIRKKMTLKFLWESLIGFLKYCQIPQNTLNSVLNKRTHFQFE
ncbi:MAG: hypothetical protein DRH26_11000 [Deltaproteobacteria bacterium]|nr:MAG: hypothetical protein DRH26_11000 [Deltaproteobacteria bacterium]